MKFSYLHDLLILESLAILSTCSNLAISGNAVTTRYWDCCKPSCSWNGKAKFSQPVQSCDKGDNPVTDFNLGTGCNGGSAYSCTDQTPWAVNNTFSYGFAGIFIKGHVEDYWCCACYELSFTSGPVKGKTMIVQAHNTAYDVNTANRFSLGIPGGNTSTDDACANEFSVSQSVFGQDGSGVSSIDDCDNLPTGMQAGCRWRFEWFQDALYPTATFKRVVCPTDLTNKTGCTRDDDKALASQIANPSNSSSASPSPSLSSFFVWSALTFAAVLLAL